MQPDSEHIENWRPVVGFEGSYEVSDLGRVRSVDRHIQRGGALVLFRGTVLRPILSGRGDYLTVSLKRQSRNYTRTIHRLVAEAFLGPCPAGLECRHLNGDGHDNRLSNLRWGTHDENVQDTVAHGTHPQAAKTACKRGHSYTPQTVYVWTDPRSGQRHRQCLVCQSERRRARRAAV